MPFKISSYGLSDIGLVRHKNEDVWNEIPEKSVFILADGMGGHRAGDVAAREAVNTLMQLLQEVFDSIAPEESTLFGLSARIRLAIEEVNRRVYALGKTDEALRGMGTTLCCLHVHAEGIIYANVGDSRIYRLRDGELEQLSEDHSLLRELVAAGQIREQNVSDFAYKNIITKAIGTEPIVEPSIEVADVQEGDTFLLCSDGLSDLVASEDIQEILNTSPSLQETAAALISAAKARGGPDNITVVLIRLQVSDEKSDLPR